MNLLRELRIGQPGLQGLISEASFTGEEKILPIRRDDGAEIEGAGIDLRPKIDSFRPCSVPPKADIKIAVSVAFGASIRDKDEVAFIRRDIGITFGILCVDRIAQVFRLCVFSINQSRAVYVSPPFSTIAAGTEVKRPVGGD